MRHENEATGCIGAFIEPELDFLIDAMRRVVAGRGEVSASYGHARQQILDRLSWRNVAIELARATVGYSASSPAQVDIGSRVPDIRSTPPVVGQREVLEVIGLIRPWVMRTTEKVRIGNPYDGGYVLPAIALQCDGALSIGVGNDVSFDVALAEAGASILQYDHTVEKSPSQHPSFTFHRSGWGLRSEGTFTCLADMMAKLSGLGAKRLLLKFGIEGGEYDILEQLGPDELAPFEVVVCELHDLDRLSDPGFYQRVRRSLETLTRHHVPIHVHANNYRGFAVAAGVPVPEVLEVSLLRRDLDCFPERSREPMPGPLDRPNHPLRPDLCLTVF